MNDVVTQAQVLTAQQSSNPTNLIDYAMANGADLDRLERLWNLKLEYEKNEAKKAYHAAIAAFKANPPEVVKDLVNKQYGSRYSSLANLVNTVSKALAPHQLSANWKPEQNGNEISVTCILSHALGHSETATLKGPPDKSGQKNELQQVKSTITYLKGATFEAVTGIAVSEFDADDDGNGAGSKFITEQQGIFIHDYLEETKANKVKFLAYMGVTEVASILAKDYDKAITALKQQEKAMKKAAEPKA